MKFSDVTLEAVGFALEQKFIWKVVRSIRDSNRDFQWFDSPFSWKIVWSSKSCWSSGLLSAVCTTFRKSCFTRTTEERFNEQRVKNALTTLSIDIGETLRGNSTTRQCSTPLNCRNYLIREAEQRKAEKENCQPRRKFSPLQTFSSSLAKSSKANRMEINESQVEISPNQLLNCSFALLRLRATGFSIILAPLCWRIGKVESLNQVSSFSENFSSSYQF